MTGVFTKKILLKKIWLLIVIIFFIMAIIFTSFYFFFETRYNDEVYPNVYVGQFNLGGYSVKESRSLIKDTGGLFQKGIEFKYKNKTILIKPNSRAKYFKIDIDESIYKAFNYGRDSNMFINNINRIKTLFFNKHVLLAVDVDIEKLKNKLKDNFSEFENKMQEASIVLNHNEFKINPGREGEELNYDQAINLFKKNIERADTKQIELKLIVKKPTILIKNTEEILTEARDLFKLAPLTLTYKNFQQKIDKNILVSWFELQNNQGKISVGINQEKVKKYLQQKIKPKIDRQPTDANFERTENRVTIWKPAKNGLNLDLDATVEKIIKELVQNHNSRINLVVGEIRSLSPSSKDAEDLGLIQILGVGESNFSGSPANRIHNIKVGAKQLNGLLIKPDEEFSLLGALGNVDADAGYLPELVIKTNETVPEYGGGLCQIATTTFRAVLHAGLPITMRRNHTYRVSYYEPAGTDATIYDPWPDFRFKNDTGKYIMLRTKIKKNKLIFTFWGTKDGRKIEMSDPVIYNITKPKETKIIETTDLPVGEKKCTEHAHNGADAYFDYKIIYPNGEIKKKRYQSHYIPWQGVCMVGVKALPEKIGPGSSKWDKFKKAK